MDNKNKAAVKRDAILVCGHIGTGKTTLVHQVLFTLSVLFVFMFHAFSFLLHIQ